MSARVPRSDAPFRPRVGCTKQRPGAIRSCIGFVLAAASSACAAASTHPVVLAPTPVAPPVPPTPCDPALALLDGGRVAVPRGRHVAPGLHGLLVVYRGEHARSAGAREAVAVQRDEPPPHEAIELTQISCSVHVDEHGVIAPPRCEPTPAVLHDHSTSEGAWHALPDEAVQHVRACYAASDRAASGADVHHVEHIAEPWPTVGSRPRIVLVRTARVERVPQLESYGCEGVHDQPCDRATRPTGRMIDATRHMDVALYALRPDGARVLHGVFPATGADLRLLYFTVAAPRSYGGQDVAPEMDTPGYHPLDANYLYNDRARMDCYYPAFLARLAQLDLDPQDHAAQLVVLYDRVTLALLMHDAPRVAETLAALHTGLSLPPDPDDTVARPFVAARIDALDALAAGALSPDDPCRTH